MRQGDTLGPYRITVRQLESMIRLSEAMARLQCDTEIKPVYVREAFRLLKTSIIQVETNDVDAEDDDDNDDNDPNGAGQGVGGDDGDEEMEDDPESQETEPETQQLVHPGEYGDAAASAPPVVDDADEQAKKKRKKKTKISFEEYELMANAIASHLRSLERDDDDDDDENKTRYLKWSEVVNWHLEQQEQDIGASVEKLEEARKKVNLVIRRLLNKENVLVTVGQPPKNKREEQQALLAVHPNYVVQ